MPRLSPSRRLTLGAALVFALGGAAACDSTPPVADGAHAPPAAARQIIFEGAEGTLELGFGRVVPVKVRVSPPEEGVSVRFALVGDVADAALDTGRALTDVSGEAFAPPPAGSAEPLTISLHASSRDASFVLEARLDSGEMAELGVTISSRSMPAGSVAARPTYSGKRAIGGWVAQARPGETCALLGAPAVPAPGGPGWVEGLTIEGGLGGDLTINNLTPGEPFALLVWGGPFARGCQDVASGVKTAKLLEIGLAAQNVDLDLRSLQVSVSLGLDESAKAGVTSTVDDWAKNFLRAFEPISGNEGDEGTRGANALIDAMGNHIARADQTAASNFFGNILPNKIAALADLPEGMPNEKVSAWLGGAKALVGAALPEPFRADVRALGGGSFALDPSSLLGVPFLDVEGASVAGFGLAADSPTDRIAASGGVNFNRGALLAAAIARSLGVDPRSFTTTTLSTAVSCESVANVLTNGGLAPIYSTPTGTTCFEACAVTHCEGALAAMWNAARTVDEGGIAFTFAISGAATFGPTLALDGWQGGTWEGELTDTQAGTVSLDGAATATRPGE